MAGPALMMSYCVAGLTCIFAALCYAEFASMAPVAGSAYTYAYTTMGELFDEIVHRDPDWTSVPKRLASTIRRCLAKDVEAREAKQKKAVEAEMTPVGGKKAEDKKKTDDAATPDDKPKRKPPTLLRPGETVTDKKQ